MFFWRKDFFGCIISILIKIDNVNLNLVNIYVFINLIDWKIFFDFFYDFFFLSVVLIIGGDFNCYDKVLDKFGGNFFVYKDYDDLKIIFCFFDVWCRLYFNLCEFIWFNLDMLIGSCFDKFLILKDFF